MVIHSIMLTYFCCKNKCIVYPEWLKNDPNALILINFLQRIKMKAKMKNR